MNQQKAEILITKYLTDQISEKEKSDLIIWMQEADNEFLIEEFIKMNFASDYNLSEFDSKSTEKLLLDKIRKDKSVFYRKRFISTMKYAAMLVLFVGIGFFFKDVFFAQEGNETQIVRRDDAIILELENGKTEILDPSKTRTVQNGQGVVVGRQNRNVIRYVNDVAAETLVYNTLKVPSGKQFSLVLSDGTKVFLNSGTSIKYPIKFLQGQKREVFLTGEAFFDVEEDKAHPFIVNANEMDITVLGTEFVVSLYDEDSVTSVVLLEGAVNLSKGENTNTTHLTPGSRGVLDNRTGKITKENVNTGYYTAWIDGVLIFRNMTFDTIARKLERIYNVTIVSRNQDFSNEVFNASFDNQSIENILSYFKDSYDMNYSIEDNVIYIN